MDSIRMPTGCEDIFADEDSGPLWPQWLEAFRVPDGPRAAAYEGTPAHLRAAIKTALALHQAHAGEMDSRTCRDERFPRRRPLPWWPSRRPCVRPPGWRRPSCPPSWPVCR